MVVKFFSIQTWRKIVKNTFPVEVEEAEDGDDIPPLLLPLLVQFMHFLVDSTALLELVGESWPLELDLWSN